MTMKTKILLISILAAALVTGCVKDEIFQGPPAISNVALNPQAPLTGQAVTINATVTDMNGIKSVKLFYKVNQGNFTAVTMSETSTNLYTGEIPGQESDVTVSYYILAENIVGKSVFYPTGAPTSTVAYTIGAPSILMNEIYSRGVPADPDWIEIYNNSDITVDISGYKIYDSGGQSGTKPKMLFPAGSIIPPRGYLVIVTDVGGETGFGLSSAGEEVWFENASGSLIDNVTFSAMEVTQSYGRYPDGSANWQLLPTITKGAANANAK